MIMPQPHRNDETRIFSGVLNDARKFWNQFNCDASAKTAQGLYPLANDTARVVDLTYNDQESRLRLELRLKPVHNPETVCSRLVHFQDRWSMLLASVTYDREDHFIRVQSKTVLDPTQQSGLAVRAIFEDLRRIVNDPCFQQILC